MPGAYLHTELDDNLIMKLKGILTEMLVNIDPNIYQKYVVIYNYLKVLRNRLKELYMDCFAVHFYFT